MSASILTGTSRVFIILLLGCVVAEAAPASIGTQLTTAEKRQLQQETRMVVDLLQNHHYSGRSFREVEGKAMISRFLEELDPGAEFLEAADHESLRRRFDRTFKSVYLFRGDLQPAFEMFDLFVNRALDRLDWVQKRLGRSFDFTLPDVFVARKNAEPFASREEANRYWDLLLKEHLIVEQLRGRSPTEAVAEVRRRNDQAGRAIRAYDSLAVRERFFDGIIRSFDPHSGYFSADSAKEFSVEMEKAVEGLGLALRKQDGHCIVTGVHAGGAADLNTEITPGDIIEALAEGDGPWVDFAGLRLREVVGLCRGTAGSRVRLAYRHGELGDRLEAELERTRTVLGAERAHGAVSVVPSPDGRLQRIGWIDLPSFYSAGEKGAITSATRDVRALLVQMSATPLDGLVIDLRNNPGGALPEAVTLSELFLPRGVMMLSRSTDGKIKEHSLAEGVPFYTGPLVVLTSSTSASASEVFSGAMKYHHRAVIVGAPATYGKGTVQAYLALGKIPGGNQKDWGTLRLTVERFYQPDGTSVQSTGILADIVFPEIQPAGETLREVSLPGALPAESVTPAIQAPRGDPAGAGVSGALLTKLSQIATQNFAALPEWALVHEEQKLRPPDPAPVTRSLDLEKRRAQWNEQAIAAHAWRQNQRTIIVQAAYPTVPFEIKEVQDSQAAQNDRLALAGSDGRSCLNRLHQGAFVIKTETGRLRKLRLEAIEYPKYLLDAGVIAARLADATGRPAEPETVAAFLRAAGLLEHPTEAALLEAMARQAGASPADVATRQALESLLAEIVTLDDGIRRERAPLDVPLRESLRLAAAWAALLAPVSPPL
jgi:carboxyl-terminal processing protease